MSTIDRRSGKDRRNVARFNVNIDVEWETKLGRKKGTVSDLSLAGCFVLCSGDVEDGDKIKLLWPLSDGMKVQFSGEVVNHTFEIGFAMNFVELSGAQRDFLKKFIESLK